MVVINTLINMEFFHLVCMVLNEISMLNRNSTYFSVSYFSIPVSYLLKIPDVISISVKKHVLYNNVYINLNTHSNR